MKPIRVLIVDDSGPLRDRLQSLLEEENDIHVIRASPFRDATPEAIRDAEAAVVLVGAHSDAGQGIRFIERMAARREMPVLVLTDDTSLGGAAFAFEALRAGATDCAVAPHAEDSNGRAALRARVRRLSRFPSGFPGPDRIEDRPWDVPSILRAAPPVISPGPLVVGIAGAEGSVSSLLTVLSALNAQFPGCLALALAVPIGFSASFAAYLQAQTQLQVLVADRAVKVRAGTVVLAADDRHLVAPDAEHLGPSAGPPIQGRRPAADVLFRSLAETFGREAVGVMLSGLGDDGSSGLLAMRSAGALTIAESKDTAAAYGMPRAALEHGAALRSLPSSHIATVLQGAAAEHRALRNPETRLK